MPRGGVFVARVAQRTRNAVNVATELGLAVVIGIVGNTVRSGHQRVRERRSQRGPTTSRTPGRLLAVEKYAPGGGPLLGARYRFVEAELELVFLAPEVVRVSWCSDAEPPPRDFPDALSLDGCEIRFEGDHQQGGCRLVSPCLTLEVSAEGGIRYADPGDRTLRVELPPRRRGPHRSLRCTLRDGELVAGLGERSAGVDLRGGEYRLWNRDPGGTWGPGTDPLYCGIPVIVGLHPEGNVLVFHDNSHEAVARVDGHHPRAVGDAAIEIRFAGGMLRHYVMVGDLPRLLERYAALTGYPPLPPRWALGYHHSRWGFRSGEDVYALAGGFEREGLPLSALHLDIDYMEGYRVFTIDGQRFSDLADLSRHVAARGTRLVAIVDPGVKVDGEYDVYRDGQEGGHFVRAPGGGVLEGEAWPGRAAFPDFTDPDTRTWWSGCYPKILDAGVAGIWHDMNEPTSITLCGDSTLPRTCPHVLEGRGGLHVEAHNIYGLLMNRAGWQGTSRARPGRRPFVVSRSGWAGVQRWAWVWTGDSESTWEGLHQQVATLLGLGISGVPFTGSDIGGFSGAPAPELYVRWLELAVLVPFCRTHSVIGAPPREPWRFGEPYRGAIGRLVRARYRLLPYLYTLCWEASVTGHPVLRPLCWRTDGATRPRVADDQFFLGDALLVAPVTRRGAGERSLWVPEGTWYRWDVVVGEGGEVVSEDWIRGGRTLRAAAPLGHPVVYVRAGSIMPVDDAWSAANPPTSVPSAHEPLDLSFHCWPDADARASGVLYDDAGDGEGPHRVERLWLEPAGGPGPGGHRDGDEAGGTLVLRREVQGEFRAPSTVRVVLHGVPVGTARVDGTGMPVATTRSGAAVVECPGDFTELLVLSPQRG